MDLSEIMGKCSKLDIYEQRYNSEDYKELVFFHSDFERWIKVIEKEFGPASKPSGKAPNPEHLKMTENFGGIEQNQVLFQKKKEGATVIVMLWPWSDNEHVTLKIAVFK